MAKVPTKYPANDEPVFDGEGNETVHFTNKDFAQLFLKTRDPVSFLSGWEYMTAVGRT